ncbi:RluA family pseudouridine synthase [Candidatus Saccharibacteria bacterium]|nr:RluA family pseudouridine synthase [Candidatus Saccharibacteria bacterium]
MKVSSRDILDVLRRFELAGDDNVPRNIESVRISNPNPINTMASFNFNRQKFYLLFDDTADDDVNHVMAQIRTKKADVSGELIKNPRDSELTYGMPLKGKECYLFQVISSKKRLDSELALRYPENSRSTWQKYVRAGYVTVNGQAVDSPKHEITETDKIAVNPPDKPDFSGDELPIVYIDDNVIVINKPSGVLTHAKGALNEEFTVAEFFRKYTSYNLDTNRPGIIHRLDRDTSGVMIGARNLETATMLQKQFADRKVKKTYVAVLNGIPKLLKANIDLPIERNPSAPSTFRVGSNGKLAVTRYEVLGTSGKLALVKLQPQTGRTHQLRVHVKYLGTPILGDRVYGKESGRLFLHAYSLEITIPNGDRKIFTTPVPNEFLQYFADIKL